MLKSIRGKDNINILAWETDKSESPFFCPECKEAVILKQGIQRIDHFSHKPNSSCSYGEGESAEHMICKRTIYEGLKIYKGIDEIEIDKNLGDIIPNIYFLYNGNKVAIEVVNSNLDGETIINKSENYTDKNIYTLWLIIYRKRLDDEDYNPSQLERILHQIYYGRVFYRTSGLNIQPIHFESKARYIPSTDRGGGYDKYYKNKKEVMQGKELNLYEDFKIHDCKGFDKSSFPTPPLKIFTNIDKKRW